jgi:hypothetical protein
MSVAVLAGVVAVLALAVNLAVHQVEQGTHAGALGSTRCVICSVLTGHVGVYFRVRIDGSSFCAMRCDVIGCGVV